VTARGTAPPVAPGGARSLRPAWGTVRGWASRRSLPGLTWIGSFAALTALLLARNAYLFTTRIYEDGDYAANTIAVLQAKHFGLLTGNYSVAGFYHPGPAFLYAQAAGEAFFYDLLHAVPTPWNGQVLAILLLNAALLAACVAVIARHAGSGASALACLALVLLFAALHPMAVNSIWLPYAYIAPALLLLVSGASVAAGRTADLPLLALSALLCINGHAEFLLFAPVTVVVALAGLIVTRRRAAGTVPAVPAWHWALALGVAALLALPIIADVALHWPGVFGGYITYLRNPSGSVTHRSVAGTVKYLLRFWWPGRPAGLSAVRGLAVAAVLGILALVAALRCPRPDLRRFLLWSVGLIGLTTVLFLAYAYEAISDIVTNTYIGYFYWAVPLLAALVAVTGMLAWAGRRPATARRAAALLAPLAAAVAAAGVFAGLVPLTLDAPGSAVPVYRGEPGIPGDVRALAAAAGGRPVVLQIEDNSWVSTVGIVTYADRAGVRSCIVRSSVTALNLMFRAQSLCTPAELRTGARFTVGVGVIDGRRQPVPQGSRVVVTVPGTDTRITTA
jgi:hypothetical protein